jgi:hypothetical protein
MSGCSAASFPDRRSPIELAYNVRAPQGQPPSSAIRSECFKRGSAAFRPETPMAPHPYVRRYQLPSRSIVTVSRQGGRLFIEAAGQARIELSAGDCRNIFTGADAQVRFDMDAQGRAARFVLHRAGTDVSATRVE